MQGIGKIALGVVGAVTCGSIAVGGMAIAQAQKQHDGFSLGRVGIGAVGILAASGGALGCFNSAKLAIEGVRLLR